jgi:circadian clock protein KaiC
MVDAGDMMEKRDDELVKVPTGIRGFDEITGGGLPQGRPALVAGGPGCGKTLFGMEFLVRGATQFNEPGVFVSFEETEKDLVKNVKSLGFDLQDLMNQGKIIIDYVFIERREILETGEYDLEGLFVRLADSIDTVGAKRMVLDTIEALFSGFPNESILRAEIRRLFRWLKDKGITTVVTAERGKDTLTRHGLEEYLSDCVIFLDHRVTTQVSTRRFRIVKYRGSMHGTNEYPFLIDNSGLSILPVTSVGLDYTVSSERVSSGIPRLDTMLGGEGFYRGSSVLVSGTAGTGKTSAAACFADATCGRGERCLYFAFEESQSQIIRNMKSIGVDLEKWVKKGLLRFHAARPTAFGLETHLVTMHKLISELTPSTIIMDPISNLVSVGDPDEVKMLLMRLVDLLKKEHITSLFTSLVVGGDDLEGTKVGVSSLMDTWVLVRDIETQGERNRGMYVIKSRGMAHSNQVREFLLTDKGVELIDVYVGPAGVLAGAARATQEAMERAEAAAGRQEAERKLREIERRRKVRDAQIAALRADSESDEEETKRLLKEANSQEAATALEREQLARLRKADDVPATKSKGKRGGPK